MKRKIESQKLIDLKRKMADMFDMSFGHKLSDEEHEQNYQEYLKLRAEYITELENESGKVVSSSFVDQSSNYTASTKDRQIEALLIKSEGDMR